MRQGRNATHRISVPNAIRSAATAAGLMTSNNVLATDAPAM